MTYTPAPPYIIYVTLGALTKVAHPDIEDQYQTAIGCTYAICDSNNVLVDGSAGSTDPVTLDVANHINVADILSTLENVVRESLTHWPDVIDSVRSKLVWVS